MFLGLCGHASASLGSNSNNASLTVYSAPAASFVGASLTAGIFFFPIFHDALSCDVTRAVLVKQQKRFSSHVIEIFKGT